MVKLACRATDSRHLSVKAARTQEGSIQYVRSVGGSQDNDSCVALKAIHLCEKLVDGLLTLVIAATHAGTTLPAHSINLIDEDNAGCLGLCLQQQVLRLILKLAEHLGHV